MNFIINKECILQLLKIILLLLIIYLIIKYFLESNFYSQIIIAPPKNNNPIDINLESARLEAQKNINSVIEESFSNYNSNKTNSDNNKIEIVPYLNRPNKTTLQLFYKPSCPHCINFMPTWTRIINDLPNDASYEEINCDVESQRATENNISSVPSIILLVDNEKKIYMGNRTYSDIKRFLSINGVNLISRTLEKFKMDSDNSDNKNTTEKNLNCPTVSFDKQVELENDHYMYQIFNENGQYGYASGGLNPDKLLTPYQAAFSTVDSYLSSLPDSKNPTKNTYKNIDECASLYANQIMNFGLCDLNELNKIEAYADNVSNGKNKIYIDGTDYNGNQTVIKAIKKVCGFNKDNTINKR